MVSVYPCELHGGRIRGALEAIRVTLLVGQRRYTRRLRVCPADLTELLHTHEAEWEMVSDEGLGPMASVCQSPECADAQRDPVSSAFVYVWRRGSPQSEYYGQYCQRHADKLIADFGLVEEPDGRSDPP
jgi:hypothetical protein